MRRVSVALINLALLLSISAGATFAQEGLAVSGEDARQKLFDGNKRYVDAKLSRPNQTAQRRTEVAKGQRPFAAILSCSDSRVPPEIIFDQGLGDLFVIRLAGNVVDDAVLGSLEYAVDHLGIRYIMVLGHERCGAVDATVKGGQIQGHISGIVKAIEPALEKVKNLPGDVLDNAVRANVSMVVQQLKSSGPILEESVKKGALVIDGARYDLDDGKVTAIP
ncbi:MAG: carbonic anhydrase [Candidatus Omnitrophota bacterium]